jgi:transcription elongation factor Elf1
MDTPTTKYPDLQKLFKRPAEYLTAENARELLAPFICPHCDSEETLGVFYEPNNGGTGIVCHCCGLKHPLRGVMRTLCHELISAVQRHCQLRNPENEND